MKTFLEWIEPKMNVKDAWIEMSGKVNPVGIGSSGVQRHEHVVQQRIIDGINEKIKKGDKLGAFFSQDFYGLLEMFRDYGSNSYEQMYTIKKYGISEEEYNYAIGQGDARKLALEEWGWKRVAAGDIETFQFGNNDKQAITKGLLVIYPKLINGQQEYTLHILSNNKIFNIEMVRGELRIKEAAIGNYSLAGTLDNYGLKYMHPYYAAKKYPYADWFTGTVDRI